MYEYVLKTVCGLLYILTANKADSLDFKINFFTFPLKTIKLPPLI